MEKLQKAINAIKKGDKKLGEKLLSEILRADPKNEMAWLWMSTVVDSLDHKEQCLERVLKINPDNKNAQRGLENVLRKKEMKEAELLPKLRQDLKSVVTPLESSRDLEGGQKNKEYELKELRALLFYELEQGAQPNALITRYAKKGYPRDVLKEIVLDADVELEPVGEMPLDQLLFSTKGRIPRSTYWYFSLVSGLIGLTMVVVDLVLGTFNEDTGRGLFTTIASLILMFPTYAVSIKRLHDRDRSGWFILVGMIPLVGIWMWIEVGFLRGTYGVNQYGADPLLHNRQRKLKGDTIDKIPPTS